MSYFILIRSSFMPSIQALLSYTTGNLLMKVDRHHRYTFYREVQLDSPYLERYQSRTTFFTSDRFLRFGSDLGLWSRESSSCFTGWLVVVGGHVFYLTFHAARRPLATVSIVCGRLAFRHVISRQRFSTLDSSSRHFDVCPLSMDYLQSVQCIFKSYVYVHMYNGEYPATPSKKLHTQNNFNTSDMTVIGH